MNDEIKNTECIHCANVRKQRHRVRLVNTTKEEITSTIACDKDDAAAFAVGPALYNFNVPNYFAILLRARHFAREHNLQLTWCYAHDKPCHPEDRELERDALDKKRASWLKKHDQDTCHLTSILPLAVGMPIRLTDTIDRELQIYKGDLASGHDNEKLITNNKISRWI